MDKQIMKVETVAHLCDFSYLIKADVAIAGSYAAYINKRGEYEVETTEDPLFENVEVIESNDSGVCGEIDLVMLGFFADCLSEEYFDEIRGDLAQSGGV